MADYLIESNGEGPKPLYYATGGHWTPDSKRAIRFVRKKDAKRFSRSRFGLGFDCRIAQESEE